MGEHTAQQQTDASPLLDLVEQHGAESYQQGIAAGQRDEGSEDHYDDKARALFARIKVEVQRLHGYDRTLAEAPAAQYPVQVLDGDGLTQWTPKVGCPSCGTILNAATAHCADTWHADNRVPEGSGGVRVELAPPREPVDQADTVHADGSHTYWSTHCRHGNHDACKGTCKACASPCVCTHHATPKDVPAAGS